ncbi:GrpB family protein [Flavobacterium sp.]|uniref:GrpB family protein n=1 Tax=Flavobacterium sp. TaxID=239 RepID=UPI003D13369D
MYFAGSKLERQSKSNLNYDETSKRTFKEEIATLFPVVLSHYDSNWVAIFKEKQKLIKTTLGEIGLRIEHFGSTSIPNLTAKDTIDILVEIPDDQNLNDSIIALMKNIAYDFMWQTDSEPPYMVFVKGYKTTGVKEQTFHIHMGPGNHKLWDRIYFRDYLIEFSDIAKEYETLKVALAQEFQYDRVGYRVAKTDFVVKITEEAKKYYLYS